MENTKSKAKFIATYNLYSRSNLQKKRAPWRSFACAETYEDITEKVKAFKKENEDEKYLCVCRIVEFSEKKGHYITIKDECSGYERPPIPAS